ncbi:hypothetical protein KGM_200721 [Danaus plexippus plexippus]|uniref:Uncharacterized protein n=1 Tax=Danaus plexippus plexippus TaxID=278856 RepID=A0A212EX10_DANPL|nr:hypothetical protein KGM_200721 [Danaus plexippus plexippus]
MYKQQFIEEKENVVNATELDLLAALSLHNTTRTGVSAAPGMQPQRTAYALDAAMSDVSAFSVRSTHQKPSVNVAWLRHWAENKLHLEIFL